MKNANTAHTLKITDPEDSVFSYGAVIQKYRNKAGLTQEALAKRMKTSKKTIINWESDSNQPSVSSVRQLSVILEIPLYEFLGIRNSSVPTAEESEMLREYRQLNTPNRKVVSRMIHTMLEEEMTAKDEQLLETFMILPLSYQKFAAGTGCEATGFAPRPFFVRKSRKSLAADEIVRVSGDSMEPRYHNGDLVYVEHTPGADDGDDVVCRYEEGFIIKNYRNHRLYSINKARDFGEDHEHENFTMIGRVLGIVEEEDTAADYESALRRLFGKELKQFDLKYGIE